MDTKKCKECQETKFVSEFQSYRNKRSAGIRGTCRTCRSRQGNILYHKSAKRVSEKRKAILATKRAVVIEAYGGECACCGEKAIPFLCVDHVDGGGGSARKNGTERTGSSLYHKIIKLGFPKSYRVLCHNCNMALGIYGFCPHKMEVVA